MKELEGIRKKKALLSLLEEKEDKLEEEIGEEDEMEEECDMYVTLPDGTALPVVKRKK